VSEVLGRGSCYTFELLLPTQARAFQMQEGVKQTRVKAASPLFSAIFACIEFDTLHLARNASTGLPALNLPSEE
jgi:hypothetical protein